MRRVGMKSDHRHDLADHAHCDPQQVAKNEEESFSSGLAETVAEYRNLNIRVLVDELHALFDAPHAAVDAANEHERRVLKKPLDDVRRVRAAGRVLLVLRRSKSLFFR